MLQLNDARFRRDKLIAAIMFAVVLSVLPILLRAEAALVDDRQLVADANDRLAQALMAGDADRVSALYDEQAVLLPPGVAPLVGAAAIRDFWGAFLANSPPASFRLITEGLESISPATLVEHGRAVTDSADGSRSVMSYLVVWKIVEGQVLILRDAISPRSVPTP